jgi:DNA ligase-1
MELNLDLVKEFDTLYSTRSSGKINVWNICIKKDDTIAYICTYTGQEGGKITEHIKKISVGKNIGKKNETTVVEQAISEAQSAWNKKKDKNGCRTDRDELKDALTFVPMSAQYFEERKKYINFETAYVQPKLDGVRCVLKKEGNEIKMFSKNGLEFNNLDHIKDLVSKLKFDDNVCLDGELYTEKFPFNKINGYVRRLDNKLKKDDLECIKNIDYHIFDCFDIDNVDWEYENRHKYLIKLLKKNKTQTLTLVKTIPIKEIEQVYDINKQFIDQGYEGIMIRNSLGKYKNSKTRSNDLQKYKLFKDDEYEITGFQEGEARDEGTVIWMCKIKNNKEFAVRPKGTLEERREMFKNGEKCIGKMLTVKYQELSDKGIPRFPVGLRIREID